jgi:hypothetical protein
VPRSIGKCPGYLVSIEAMGVAGHNPKEWIENSYNVSKGMKRGAMGKKPHRVWISTFPFAYSPVFIPL